MKRLMKLRQVLLATMALTLVTSLVITGCAAPVSAPSVPPVEQPTPGTEPPGPEPPEPTPEPPKEAPEPEPPPPDYATIGADILGQTVSFDIGGNAGTWDAVDVTSADGNIRVAMAWGTELKDKDGNAIADFSATINPNPDQPEDGSLLVGSTVTFMPDSTTLNPALTLDYDYSAFADQIAAVPDAEVYLAQFIHGSGNWAKLYTELDTDAMTAQAKIDKFALEHTIGLIAAPPPPEVVDPDAPSNGVDLKIEYVSTINADEAAQLIVKTNPDAWVLTWWVLPVTGTRTTRPVDRWRQADADGKIIWDFTLSTRTAKGEGRMEFYITTSTDEDFLKYVENNRLDVPYPDLTADLKNLKNGKIAQIVADNNTTVKMFPFTVAKGL